jgi:hypothetical protein
MLAWGKAKNRSAALEIEWLGLFEHCLETARLRSRLLQSYTRNMTSKSDIEHWQINATVYKDRVEEIHYITDPARNIRRDHKRRYGRSNSSWVAEVLVKYAYRKTQRMGKREQLKGSQDQVQI